MGLVGIAAAARLGRDGAAIVTDTRARGDGELTQPCPEPPVGTIIERGGCMAKLHARPSNQYRYEHYDPRF
jgi:hypothetical protein